MAILGIEVHKRAANYLQFVLRPAKYGWWHTLFNISQGRKKCSEWSAEFSVYVVLLQIEEIFVKNISKWQSASANYAIIRGVSASLQMAILTKSSPFMPD